MTDSSFFDSTNTASSFLLRGGNVLTLDADASVLPSTDVLVARDKIAAVGRNLEISGDTKILDVSDCWVLPGLVQGHIHLGQTFFRGLAEGRRLLPWLRERIWPLEAAHDDESAYWCAMLGISECLLSGTSTVQEIGLGPGAPGLLRAIHDAGIRAQAGMCLMDCGEGMPDGLFGDTDRILSDTVALGERYDNSSRGRMRYLLNPRFILSCSDDLWREIEVISTERGWPVHTHALEQREETEVVRKIKEGRDEIEYFDEMGVLATDLRIAHGVWLTSDHLATVGSSRFSVAHCPSTNLKLGSGVADVVRIRRAGVPVGVGSDGAACNNELDAFKELRLAAQLQQLTQGPEAFSGLDALRLATSEGARAIGFEDRVGSIEAGKCADLLVLDCRRPEFFAASNVDPHDLIAFGGSRAAVRHLVVDGELLVSEGHLTRLDLTEIRRQASRCLKEVLRRAGLELAGS